MKNFQKKLLKDTVINNYLSLYLNKTFKKFNFVSLNTKLYFTRKFWENNNKSMLTFDIFEPLFI